MKTIKVNININQEGYTMLKIYDYKIEIPKYLCEKKDRNLLSIYSCNRCGDIAVEPKMCRVCNILICQNCVDKIYELPREKQVQIACNDCKNPLSLTEIQKCTRKGLEMLHIKCPSNNVMCYEGLKLKDINSHLQSCKFFEGRARCNYCNIVDKTNTIIKHLETCIEIPIPCKYCEDPIAKSIMLNHEETCYRKPKSCKTCKIAYEEGKIITHETTKDECMLKVVKEISEKLESK
jgi:hypothetical protein